MVPVFHISTGRRLLSWQENCGVCVEYEKKQDREKQRLTHCYTVQVSVSNEECPGPKLECSVTDVALLRLALFNLIFGGGSSTLSSRSNGGATAFQAVAKPESEPEPEPGNLIASNYTMLSLPQTLLRATSSLMTSYPNHHHHLTPIL